MQACELQSTLPAIWYIQVYAKSTKDNWEQLERQLRINRLALINCRKRRSKFTPWQLTINSLTINYSAITAIFYYKYMLKISDQLQRLLVSDDRSSDLVCKRDPLKDPAPHSPLAGHWYERRLSEPSRHHLPSTESYYLRPSSTEKVPLRPQLSILVALCSMLYILSCSLFSVPCLFIIFIISFPCPSSCCYIIRIQKKNMIP